MRRIKTGYTKKTSDIRKQTRILQTESVKYAKKKFAKALLVSHDELSSRSLSRLLNKLGCEVLPMYSVDKALDVCKREDFHRVILDTGIEQQAFIHLIRQIKKHKPKTKILVIVSIVTKTIEEEFKKAGTDMIMDKPFGIESMIEALND